MSNLMRRQHITNMPASETKPLIGMRGVSDNRSAKSDLHADIARYYDECFIDYRFAWLNTRNLAIHYGYWDESTRTHSESLLNMNKVMARRAGVGADDHVFDAGCGVGGSSIWLAENFGCRVTGVTLSANQVAHANTYAKERGVAHLVNFQRTDYCATPFPDGSFDVVWGLESICYAMDKNAFVAEAYRLLRDGGCLIVADGFARQTEFTPAQWQIFLKFLDGWSVPNLATPEQLVNHMTDQGFEEVSYRDITANVLPSAKRMHKISLLIYPLEKLLSWLKIRTKAQTGNYYAGLNQLQIFEQGMTQYGMLSAVKRARHRAITNQPA